MRELTSLHLLEIQVATLFTHDAECNLLRINEPGGEVAPRFFFGRTAERNIWRVRADLEPSVRAGLIDLAASEPVTDDLGMLPVHLAEMRRLLGGAEVAHHGPAWIFPRDVGEPAKAVRLTRDHQPLMDDLPGWQADFDVNDPAHEPRYGVLDEGRVVAICGTVRLSERAAEAEVETVPGYRGRGYAVEAVAAWARETWRLGRIPLYSTSWDNPASRAVARKLGLRLYGADLSLA